MKKMKSLKIISLSTFVIAFVAVLSFSSCNTPANENDSITVVTELEISDNQTITEQEVLDIQQIWGEGIVTIGNEFTAEGDYEAAARNHIETLYGYDLGVVLFKPTMASEKQFRTTFDGALSYFVAGNEEYTEDHGFAIKPWTNVRFESTGVIIEGNMAVAMGNYFFTPADGNDEVKVEYTFAYTKDADGNLKIIMHGSHLPYSPEH